MTHYILYSSRRYASFRPSWQIKNASFKPCCRVKWVLRSLLMQGRVNRGGSLLACMKVRFHGRWVTWDMLVTKRDAIKRPDVMENTGCTWTKPRKGTGYTTSKHHSAMPFWAWRRFSASSQITDCGPSITSGVTSSPRCAGRQCRNSASGAPLAINVSFT